MDKHGTWKNSEAREWADVKGPDAKVIRLHIILGKKHVELGPKAVKWKARIVGNGGDLRDWLNQKSDPTFDLYTLPVSVTGVRLIVGLSLAMPDWVIVQFDVEGAYLQCPRKAQDCVWARIPIQYQDENMKKMRDPVVPLRTKVYGEVDAGDCYAA